MLKQLSSWIDDRTGYQAVLHEVLFEKIPGGARWRYVWGSTLVFAFVTQVITGTFLWMHYSPSTQTAWESVYYIQHEMTGGWLLRGVHHYMAQLMIVLMALHLMQVVIAGAYRAPREINFWLGLALMLVVFGLGLTGYLLPWDQKGYWATQVATKIAGASPLIGDELKALAVGGNEYGHHTLTRFFAVHAGVLPGAMFGLIALHLAMFRKHGITHNREAGAAVANFWPDQVLKDAVACLAVLLTVCGLSYWMGAELGAPADPSQAYNAARPEWYYLFLFQLLKIVDHVAPGEAGIVLGAHILPAALLGVMAFMPILGRWNLGHRFNVGFMLILLIACGGLTAMAVYEDRNGATPESQDFLAAEQLAKAEGHRAQQLATQGIPPTGMLSMVQEDSLIAGSRLFKQHCAACHSHFDLSNQSIKAADHNPLVEVYPAETYAANLYRFGSREWMAGVLDAEKLASPMLFGNTLHADTEMINWVRDNITDAEDKQTVRGRVTAVAAAISAQAALPYQAESDAADAQRIATGLDLAINEFACTDCHKLGDEGDLGTAPDLTGYASRQWLIEFINNPQAERFYSPDNYDDPTRMMPPFADKLTGREIELIADWLRHDWYLPAAPVSAREDEPPAEP